MKLYNVHYEIESLGIYDRVFPVKAMSPADASDAFYYEMVEGEEHPANELYITEAVCSNEREDM